MKIPSIVVPHFNMTLPHAKRAVSFRPYLVKEEKLLVMASESDDVESAIQVVGDIVKACTNGDIDITKDSMVDVQYAFLQIRGKSQGESIELYSLCTACNVKNFISITAEDFTIMEFPNHQKTFKLTDDVTVTMRYPTIQNFGDLYADEDEQKIFHVVAECIESLVTPDETFINDGSPDSIRSFLEFLDSLTPELFEHFDQFFVTMPILQCKREFYCSGCRTKNNILVDGITSFFE